MAEEWPKKKCDVCGDEVFTRYPKRLNGKRVYVCGKCLSSEDFDEEG